MDRLEQREPVAGLSPFLIVSPERKGGFLFRTRTEKGITTWDADAVVGLQPMDLKVIGTRVSLVLRGVGRDNAEDIGTRLQNVIDALSKSDRPEDKNKVTALRFALANGDRIVPGRWIEEYGGFAQIPFTETAINDPVIFDKLNIGSNTLMTEEDYRKWTSEQAAARKPVEGELYLEMKDESVALDAQNLQAGDLGELREAIGRLLELKFKLEDESLDFRNLPYDEQFSVLETNLRNRLETLNEDLPLHIEGNREIGQIERDLRVVSFVQRNLTDETKRKIGRAKIVKIMDLFMNVQVAERRVLPRNEIETKWGKGCRASVDQLTNDERILFDQIEHVRKDGQEIHLFDLDQAKEGTVVAVEWGEGRSSLLLIRKGEEEESCVAGIITKLPKVLAQDQRYEVVLFDSKTGKIEKLGSQITKADKEVDGVILDSSGAEEKYGHKGSNIKLRMTIQGEEGNRKELNELIYRIKVLSPPDQPIFASAE